MPKLIRRFVLVMAACLPLLAPAPTRAQETPATAHAATAAGLTPAEARQALEVLQDPKKLAATIATLKAVAEASPHEAKPAAAQPVALAPHSLGAQLLAEASRSLTVISTEIAETARAVTDFPLIWRWIRHTVSDPSARVQLLDAVWKLALLLGCALAVEWGVAWLVRRPLAALAASAPDAHADGNVKAEGHGEGEADQAPAPQFRGRRRRRHGHSRRSWRLLRLLPVALARLVLDLMPVVAFAVVGNLLLGTTLGASETTRLVILAIVNAYVICRAVMCVTRMLVSPADARLRLLLFADETAAYIEVWMRRIAVVTVFGGALAEVALLLGLAPEAHDALVRLVALVAHLFLVVIVLQCRRGIARWIHAAEGARGPFALMRNRLAGIWHYVAIFVIMALWVAWAIDVKNGFLVLIHYFVVTVAVVVVARLISVLALGALDRLFRISPDFVRRFPGLEARANRYYPVLRGALSGIIVIVAAIALLEVWGLDALLWFQSGAIGGRLVSALVVIGVTAIVAIAVWEFANAAIERHVARLTQEGHFVRAARLRTLLPMLRTTLLLAMLAMVGLTTLSEVGVNIAPLLAGAGIVGVAIGFGSQKLVQDLINGMFLLLENAMQVGDWVTVAGLSGTVENLSIRTIRLRAGDGSVHIIPFSSVTSVSNTNRGIGNAAVSVNVGFGEDTDRVAEVLKEIAAGMREDAAFKDLMRSDLQLWGVDKVDGAVVTILGQIVCSDTGRWPVQREFNRRMKRRFQELGIEIANATQTIVLRERPAAAAPTAAAERPPEAEAGPRLAAAGPDDDRASRAQDPDRGQR